MFKIDEEDHDSEGNEGQDICLEPSPTFVEQHSLVEKEEERETPTCVVTPKKSPDEKQHEWNHEEITQLIEFWAAEDCLYNMRNADYKDKNERAKALLRIQKKFEDIGVAISVKDIATKMHGLRVYYGATRNKLEALKRRSTPGSLANPKVKWIYFESLNFLKDFFHPREKPVTVDQNPHGHLQAFDDVGRGSVKMCIKKRRREGGSPGTSLDNKEDMVIDTLISELPYPTEREHRENFSYGMASAHVHRSHVKEGVTSDSCSSSENIYIEDNVRSCSRDMYAGENVHSDVQKRSFVRNFVSDSYSGGKDHSKLSSQQKEGECSSRAPRHHDFLFCDMLASQLQVIPDGESKELLKYEIYGLVLRKRFMQRGGF